MIRELLTDKITSKEWAEIKATEITKLPLTGQFTKGDIKVEIVGISKIEGGLEIFARAWENDKPIGLGAGGKFETERFLFYNPSFMVSDPNGDIIRTSIDERTGLPLIDRLREDPIQAIRDDLAEVIRQFGKVGVKVAVGSIGNTTSVFYPATGTTPPSDARSRREIASPGEILSTIRSSAGTGNQSGLVSSTQAVILSCSDTTDQYNILAKSGYGFDTSPLSGQSISEGSVTIYSIGTAYDGLTEDVVLDRAVPTNGTFWRVDDYPSGIWDEVEQATARITVPSWAAAGSPNVFTLNATGIGNINTGGYSWYGIRIGGDFDNSANWISLDASYAGAYYTDEGSTLRPKLTVVHAAGGAVFIPKIIII